MTGWVKRKKRFLFFSNRSITFLLFFFSTSSTIHLPICLSFLFPSPLVLSLDSSSYAMCFLLDFIWSQSIGVLFRTWWLPLAPCGCWLTAAGDCTGLMLAYSHRLLGLLAQALYCVCLNVLIVTLYSTHLLYCTSLWGTFTHPSSLCPLFLRLRGSDGKVEGGGRGPRTKLPLWQWLTGKLLYTDVTISKAEDRAVDTQSG